MRVGNPRILPRRPWPMPREPRGSQSPTGHAPHSTGGLTSEGRARNTGAGMGAVPGGSTARIPTL